MEKIFQKTLVTAVTVATVFTLCGCSISNNNAEKNNVLIAETIDVDYSGNTCKLTVQGVNPGGEQLDEADSGSGENTSEQSSGEKPPELFGANGDFLVEAFDNLSFTNGKNILTAHNQVILLGCETLENHLTESAEFFAACNEIPVEATVYGIKNNTAEKVTSSAAEKNTSIAKKIYNLNSASSAKMTAVNETVLGIMTKKYGGISDIAIPVLSFENEELKSDGTAVFSGDKFAGYLTEEETMALLLIKESRNGGAVSTDDIYYKINKNKTDWNIEFKNNTPYITLNTVIYADINHYKNAEKIKNGMAEALLENYFKDSFKQITDKLCREYKSDVIGVLNRFSFKYPNEFKRYKNMRLDFLSKTVFDFNVNVSIENVEKNGTFPEAFF